VFTKHWFVFLALIACPVHAGVVFELETQDHTQSPPVLSSTAVAVEGSSLAMEVQAGPRSPQAEVIYRGDRREMIVVDPEGQSYMVIDLETIGAMVQQLQQMTGQFAGMVDHLPEDQRALVAQTMKNGQQQAARIQPDQVQVRNVGDNVTVNGFPCARYEVYRNGRKVSDLWVTEWRNIDGGRHLQTVFGGMADFFQQMKSAFSQQTGGGDDAMGDNMFVMINELDGFPVATYNYDINGNVRDAAILRSSRQQQLDPADFDPPAGYRRQHLFGPK
jgi:hypothetical protein